MAGGPDGLQPRSSPYLIPFPWLVLQAGDLPLTNKAQQQWQAVLPRSAWLLILASCPAVSGPPTPSPCSNAASSCSCSPIERPMEQNPEGKLRPKVRDQTKLPVQSPVRSSALSAGVSEETYRELAPAGSLMPVCLRKPSPEPIQLWSRRNAYGLALIKCWVIC